jgi:hypothetical protein
VRHSRTKLGTPAGHHPAQQYASLQRSSSQPSGSVFIYCNECRQTIGRAQELLRRRGKLTLHPTACAISKETGVAPLR